MGPSSGSDGRSTPNEMVSIIDGGWKEGELASLIKTARSELRDRNPEILASLSGTRFDPLSREFFVTVFGRGYFVTYPEFVAYEEGVHGRRESTPWIQCLLLHYFRSSNGTNLANQWISFRELPSGMFYQHAFQTYTGDRIIRAFGSDLERLKTAALAIGCATEAIGDFGVSIRALPRVPVALAYWLGDDDLPPTAKVLFDASARDYLPTDALAVVGGRFCSLILGAAGILLSNA